MSFSVKVLHGRRCLVDRSTHFSGRTFLMSMKKSLQPERPGQYKTGGIRRKKKRTRGTIEAVQGFQFLNAHLRFTSMPVKKERGSANKTLPTIH
ncbi:hypothetical protein ALCH109712_14945 [Alkalicoccus chagannorensis]